MVLEVTLPKSDAPNSPEGTLMLQEHLLSRGFQVAYGAQRTYFHLYGDREPTHFLKDAPHPAEFQKKKDQQYDTLKSIIEQTDSFISDAIPFTIAKAQQSYHLFHGHESNQIIETAQFQLCRGFILELGGSWKSYRIIQLDPNISRTLYDLDQTVEKKHFTTVLLNLMLERMPKTVAQAKNIDTKRGNFDAVSLAIVDHNFQIERIVDLKNKTFAKNILHSQDRGITDMHMPWIIA